ncbi:uncharacterized protein PITG_06475 [Phytophthora infestans T30-4]|uniref:Dynein heavy chain C-terminal domain-containing protein n=1 Tax=Phytophthora infestans (strain T30-4) TaxID=403677 RepID=D0N4X9_PHYIT|nr:uncharacterized protein PITG_06475 [Phytophthora infestans T30-4]EEY69937.1 conserved hypothetical protein [Phytophthora infestans T30-4]|eukprot:XP_002998584.1 conserved hypothetical protein [Phytophthora infestans T30-4]
MPRLGTTPTCQKLAAASVGSIRVSREDPIGNVASDIQSKVPEPIDVDHVRKKMGSTPTPTQVVLLRELDRWNLLAYRMGVSLGDLQKAVVGEIVLGGVKDDAGCYVKGLFLEGASWDLERGVSHHKSPSNSWKSCLVILIEASRLKLRNTFRTPVYVTQSRRNAMDVGLVFEANIYLPLTGYCKTSQLHSTQTTTCTCINSTTTCTI